MTTIARITRFARSVRVAAWAIALVMPVLADPAGAADPRVVYETTCSVCHVPGINGAPRVGDAAEWQRRLDAYGQARLMETVLKGNAGMPARGGNPELTDAELRGAMQHMLRLALAGPAAAPAAAAASAPVAAPAPVAAVAVAAAGAGAASGKGRQLFQSACAACHATGVAGAPRLGDAVAWGPRVKTGVNSLYASALKGKGAMPARGGSTLADADVRLVVDYMVAQAGSAPAGAMAATPSPSPVAAASTVAATPAAAAAAVPVASAAAGGAAAGRTAFQSACAACHSTGAAGAPKLGDATAWAPRIKTGVSSLYASALKGKGAMPAKGGSGLSDAEVRAAVDFLVAQAGAGGAAAPAAMPAAAAAVPAVAAAAPSPAPGAVASTAGAAPAAGAAGRAAYQSTCAACHGAGIAGAPKLGDSAAWAPRIRTGVSSLYASAMKGKGAMPAKGGGSLPDADVRAAVDFMVAQAGAKAEAAPAQPAAAAPAAAAPLANVAPVATATTVTATAAAASPVPPAGPVARPGDVNSFNRLLRAPSRRNLPPAEDGIHDAGNDGTDQLQPPLQAFGSMHKSNVGNRVDWVKSLNDKRITPRADRQDAAADMAVLDLNIVREVKGSMPDVVYPHKQHTQWLDCSNCHPAIFVPKKGANQISMASIMLGEKCGVCHGKVAFPISECRLCHSKNKEAAAGQAAGVPVAAGDRK